jgi:hypothetical protein
MVAAMGMIVVVFSRLRAGVCPAHGSLWIM